MFIEVQEKVLCTLGADTDAGMLLVVFFCSSECRKWCCVEIEVAYPGMRAVALRAHPTVGMQYLPCNT